MTTTEETLSLNITQEIFVRATVATTFEALLEQIGPGNERPDGSAMPMKIEAWPGGRWYRDLGGNDGHFWGHVQAIRKPDLLEICGPLFASAPCVSNVQYRLKEKDGGTLIEFHHMAMGYVSEQHRQGVGTGWKSILDRIKKAAEQ